MRTSTMRAVTFTSLLIMLAGTIAVEIPSVASEPDVAAVVHGNNQFACDLYKRLARQEDGNLFFSPYSISTALAMTYAGARGSTEAEMADVLHFSLPQGQLHPAFGAMIADLNDDQRAEYELRVANRLWGQQGYNFLPEFLNTTAEHYGAELAQVDFIGQTEESRQTINRWVKDQTQEKIKNLLPQGAVNSLTRLVLTNAIYFKGDWKYQFDTDLTEEAPFQVTADKQLSVPMMHQLGLFNYGAFPEFRMLEMPYSGEDLSLLTLLPNSVDGLAELEASLTVETLDQCIDQLWRAEVSVALPKFEITGEFALKDVLASMGMPQAFSPQADFSGMTGSQELFISFVRHKAFMSVSEEGTEAAAATGIGMALGIPREFYADHPFLFLIRDNATESILFLGRVTEPTYSSTPEPASLVLLATGAAGLAVFSWRRRKRRT
jgi:serpin B